MARGGAPRLRYPGGLSALWGVFAFVAGYGLTYLWVVVASDRTALLERVTVWGPYTSETSLLSVIENAPAGTAELTSHRLVGGFFFGAQFVETIIPVPSGNRVSVNFVLGAGGEHLLLLALPPAVLILSGFLATRNVTDAFDFEFDLGGRTWQRFAINGGLITMLGYLPVSLLVLFAYFRTPQPNIVTGWIVAGIIYPLVFGGVGGAIAHLVDDEYDAVGSTRLNRIGGAETE